MTLGYLKWHNHTIGTIDERNFVIFSEPQYNNVVSMYTAGSGIWTNNQFIEFLSERVVSRDRRDIEKILFRMGMSHYDILQIARITRGIHPKDLLWIALSEEELFEDVVTTVFNSIFQKHTDLVGDSIDTPEGYNIKRYGEFNGRYGVFKNRISPLHTDVESEVAVYLLAQRLGVPCCPTYRTGPNTIFSEFDYDFSKQYIVHFRRLFNGERSANEYQNLISVRPEYKKDIARMIILDFITRQDDRHLSNIAVKIDPKGESFYPLYDNGRSLFYEDTEEMVARAVSAPRTNSTSFGKSGTYWDYIRELSLDDLDFGTLINFDISPTDILSIMRAAGLTGYRLYGATEWVSKAIELCVAVCL